MKARVWWGILSFVVGLGTSAAALADPPEGKGKPDKANKHAEKETGGGKSQKGGGGDTSSVALASAGISVALARQHALDLKLDFSGYKPLPPGIRKNLARGKPLPPGIAKKMAPNNLLSRLPRHPGHDWQIAGTDLVLVQQGSAIVADVLKDVFR